MIEGSQLSHEVKTHKHETQILDIETCLPCCDCFEFTAHPRSSEVGSFVRSFRVFQIFKFFSNFHQLSSVPGSVLHITYTSHVYGLWLRSAAVLNQTKMTPMEYAYLERNATLVQRELFERNVIRTFSNFLCWGSGFRGILSLSQNFFQSIHDVLRC